VPPPAPETPRAPVPAPDDELAFLRDFERPHAEERAAFWERGRAEIPPTVLVDKPEPPDDGEPGDSLFSRRGTIAATVVAAAIVVAVGISARGVASDVVAWVLGQPQYEREYPELTPGQTIALDQGTSSAAAFALPADTASSAAEDDSLATADSLAGDSLAGESLAATEPQVAAPPKPGRRAPYSVHVGSYQTIDSGMRVVAQVQEAGLPAFLAPVSLPGKGRWQRVYVGSFADSVAARRALERLQQDGVIEEGTVRSTPWAFDLGVYPTRAAARAEAEALLRKGITAYVAGEDPARLYTGAYQTREEAELLARTLQSALDGRTATLTLREE
jgi:cell division septation protein DedD